MEFFRSHVLVCSGINCSLKGSRAVRVALVDEIRAQGLEREIKVVETGCFGLCEEGPVMVVYPEAVHYCRVTPQDVKEIVEEHLRKGRVVGRLLYKGEAVPKAVQTWSEMDFYSRQKRVVLRNCGLIDPDNIDEYIARDGYQALGMVLRDMKPQEVIQVIKDSGLRGRGGAGFPTGLKWDFTFKAAGDEKYLICNADEGEPGTFKDRLILEGDPHSVIEGMAIAAYAIGASKGYIYFRGEYNLSIERLTQALQQAREYGLLGENILGSGFDFDIDIKVGAGAYVCGEETALINSIEGKRGEPRYKPPYPASVGLWGKPTCVNNVETLANVPPIILNGAQWFRSIGTERCPGTKVFTLTGNITNAGLIEVPMGITLREIIYDIGGGIPNGRKFKMAQTGGTSGGCLPEALLDVPMDIDSLAAAGSALGSGALLIMDDTHCIIDVVLSFLRFFRHESCGQCTPCREGTQRLYELVERIAHMEATQEDVELIKRLSRTMEDASLCALGQTAPFPVLTTMRFFPEEYEAHITKGICPAGVCSKARQSA
ncbi:MAG: NADH-quinone oxidoreductase subunit NuoF [Firmicutes bacterium]|nr:NADH-quinone oxidoreductase subunit NuoF [Bacillota bacterium]